MQDTNLINLFGSSDIYLDFCFGWHLPIFGNASFEKYVRVPNSILALDMFMFAPKCVFGGKANWVICKRLWKKIEPVIPILTLNYILHKTLFFKKKRIFSVYYKVYVQYMISMFNKIKYVHQQLQIFLVSASKLFFKSYYYRYGRVVVWDYW